MANEIKDPAKFDWVLNKLEQEPESAGFVGDVRAARDLGESISEEDVYAYYDRSRGLLGKISDWIDIPEAGLASAIYASNPEYYDNLSIEPNDSSGLAGVLAGVGTLIGTGALLMPKWNPITAAAAGTGLLTSAGIAGMVGGGILGKPKPELIGEAFSKGIEALFSDPWEMEDRKMYRDVLPNYPNVAGLMSVLVPDPAFDLLLPAGAMAAMSRGAKAAKAAKKGEEVAGGGTQEAKYAAESAKREAVTSRYEGGKGIIDRYMGVEEGEEALTKEDFIKELTDYKDTGVVTPSNRGKLIREYAELYDKAPKEEVDIAYLLGKELPTKVIPDEDLASYKQTGKVTPTNHLLLDIRRFTNAIFGKGSKLRGDFIDPTLDSVFKATRVAGEKRKEFEELAHAAGVRLAYPKSLKMLRTGKQKRGEAINEKMYNAVESGNIEDLNKAERELYFWINNFYEEALFDANKVLRSLGKREIGTSYIKILEDGTKVRTKGNYLPRIWALSYFDEVWDGLRNIPDEVLGKVDEITEQPQTVDELGEGLDALTGKFKKDPWVGGRWLPFAAFAQRRTGVGKDYLKDVAETFDTYNNTIQRIKYSSRPAEIAYRAIDQLSDANLMDEQASKYLKSWLSSGVMGKRAPIDKAIFPGEKPKTFQWIDSMVSNMSRNLLSGSLQFYMTNLASFPQYVALGGLTTTAKALWKSKGELIRGLPTMLRGLGATANEAGESFARQNSKVLQAREFVKYENTGRDILADSTVLNAWEKIIESADHFNVAWGFNTGYIHAKKLGLSHEEAIKYGDDFAWGTQAVYDRAFTSPILRNRVVQTAVPFQTFTTNLFQWFTHDILRGGLEADIGKGAVKDFESWSAPKKMGIAIRFLGTAYAINLMYESMGLKGPWDLKSVIPFSPAISAFSGEAFDEPYGAKSMAFTFMDPINKVWSGLMADDYSLSDPDFRKLPEGLLMLQPWGFGLQTGRTLTGLYDVMEGSTTVPTKGGRRLRAPLDTKDKVMATLLGPRKTGAYQRVKGKFAPQPSFFQKIDRILFPTSLPPWSDDK